MTPVLFARFAERWPPQRHRCWLADQQFVAIREAELDPRRRPLILHRLHHTLHLHLAAALQANMLRTQRPAARHPAQSSGRLGCKNVGGADKTGHKCGLGCR